MIRFRTWLCAASAACGLTLGFGAQAQTQITITLPTGSSCSYNSSSQTLDCTGGGGGSGPTPTCSLSASPNSSVTAPGSITLTATCSNMTGALNYAWSGDACTSNPSSNKCQIDYAGTGPQSYTPKVTVTDSASPTPNSVGPIAKTITFTQVSGGGGGAIPGKCADGTSTKVGDTITAIDGALHSLQINGTTTAVFPFVVPPLQTGARITLTHLQTNDLVNNTPTAAFISKTPCDLGTPTVAGDSPDGQWMSGDVQGGVATITGVVNGGSSITFLQGSRGRVNFSQVNMTAGDVWYLMFQFRDSNGKNTCTGNCLGNVSVKAQQGS